MYGLKKTVIFSKVLSKVYYNNKKKPYFTSELLICLKALIKHVSIYTFCLYRARLHIPGKM